MERANLIDHILNEGNKTIRISNNNGILIYPDHNQGNDLSEASDTTRRELCGYGITKTGGTGSIFLSGVLAEIEDASTVNTNTHNNYETL